MEKKMKTWHWYLLVLIALSALGLKLWQYHWQETVIELKGQVLQVQIANNDWQQHKGLGGREDLGEYNGMIFSHPLAGRLGVVMRDMKFPIDIVWFNQGVVVDLAPNVPVENVSEEQLHKYYPRIDANLFLELPAGWTQKYGVKIGDRLKNF